MPYDLHLMTETPAGLGYGVAALIALGGTRFPRPTNPDAYYFDIFVAIVPGPQQGPQPSPTLAPNQAASRYRL